ncbi:MBL fold metallo-hydrolase [Actinomadura sp. DC4]|uniref:MBL fold metallo-hydrolase n=1 Tax=Actinomadura sp. DC4 TaxID=3055069 RepID=UPI0025B10AA8|nr:MBL fold metallo-hydrolase [Actinomadura sp. DC4]MDN3358110.1 MBL fold metallo-hydrolase [Actinomadura sp. DC4]
MPGLTDIDGLYFVGNATTIIRYGGFTLLTDPNFLRRGERAYLGYGLSSRRIRDPGLTIGELPALDGVVLSHLHGDHWDRVAQDNLDRDLPIVTTTHASRHLIRQGFEHAQGLTRWQHHEIVKNGRIVRVTALPARHAFGVLGRLLPPVIGTMLEFGTTGGETDLRVYISGDTLMHDELREIPRRYPDIDLGIVHLGGTKLLGLATVTMDGRQGADWTELMHCRRVVPVHYDDYTVFASPLSAYEAACQRRGVAEHVRFVERGTAMPFDEPR